MCTRALNSYWKPSSATISRLMSYNLVARDNFHALLREVRGSYPVLKCACKPPEYGLVSMYVVYAQLISRVSPLLRSMDAVTSAGIKKSLIDDEGDLSCTIGQHSYGSVAVITLQYLHWSDSSL